MTFNLPKVRAALLRSPEGYVTKLPANFSTHPWSPTIDGHNFKALSSAEAREIQPKSTRPHRIFVWDEVCEKWQYAGKYGQHCRSKAHKEKM